MKPYTITFDAAGEACIVFKALHDAYAALLEAVRAQDREKLSDFDAAAAVYLAARAELRQDEFAALLAEAQHEALYEEDCEQVHSEGAGQRPADKAHGCAASASAVGPAPSSGREIGGARAAGGPVRTADPADRLSLGPPGQELPAGPSADYVQSPEGGHSHE